MLEPNAPKTIEVRKFSKFFQGLLADTPERMWNRIRPYLPKNNEEIEFLHLFEDLRLVATIGANKAVARIRAGEITGKDLDDSWRTIRDRTSELREAIDHVFKLAKMPLKRPKSAPKKPPEKVKTPGDADEPPESKLAKTA